MKKTPPKKPRSKAADKKKTLTVKQQRFVEELANPKTKSATQAAINAGYSPKVARLVASQNITKYHISEAIERRIQKTLAHSKTSPEEVLGSAVFNMRASLDDLLDDEGSFDLKKSRANGSIDVVKKHKETRKTSYNPQTKSTETTVIVEIELESPAAARKEVGNYIGLEKFSSPEPPSIEELARELFAYLISKLSISKVEARNAVIDTFPDAKDVMLIETGLEK